MFEIAAVIDVTGLWLTRKQVGPPLRPKYRYSLWDPRSPEDHQREIARIGRLAWTTCGEQVVFVRADNGTWNHVDTTMAHSGYVPRY